MTRKDSGVLSSTFAGGDDRKGVTQAPAGGARKVLYYVRIMPVHFWRHVIPLWYVMEFAKIFAAQAAGSGIPEIKTILSGSYQPSFLLRVKTELPL